MDSNRDIQKELKNNCQHISKKLGSHVGKNISKYGWGTVLFFIIGGLIVKGVKQINKKQKNQPLNNKPFL